MGPSQHPNQATMYAPPHQQHHHQGASVPKYQQQPPHYAPPPPASHPHQRWQQHQQAPQTNHHHHQGGYRSVKPAQAVQHPYHHAHHHHPHAVVAYAPHHAVPHHHHHYAQPPQPVYATTAAAAAPPHPVQQPQQKTPVATVATVQQKKPSAPSQARPPAHQAPPAKQPTATTLRPSSAPPPPASAKPAAIAATTRSASASLPNITFKIDSVEETVPARPSTSSQEPTKRTTRSVPPPPPPPPLFKQSTETKTDQDDFVDLEKGQNTSSSVGFATNEYPQKPPRAPFVTVSSSKSSVFANKAATTASKGTRKTAVMSPITMCFDRMLGAAEYIKTPNPTGKGTKRGKKVLPLGTSNGQSITSLDSGEMNPFDELAADPELERLVILQMAMQRQQSIQNAPAAADEAKRSSNVISEGFFWRDVPVCEHVLYSHMERYYEISAIQRNYKVQQHFNNVLVQEVRDAAADNGFVIDPDFDDKKLRDRIRCFYKTHLQNAKKRLATLQKHSNSPENQCLVAVFIRCVRNPNLTFQESLEMAPESCIIPADKSQENVVNKKRRLDKVEKLKRTISQEGATTVGIVSDMVKPML